jgi:hypothetical protein
MQVSQCFIGRHPADASCMAQRVHHGFAMRPWNPSACRRFIEPALSRPGATRGPKFAITLLSDERVSNEHLSNKPGSKKRCRVAGAARQDRRRVAAVATIDAGGVGTRREFFTLHGGNGVALRLRYAAAY